MIDIKNIVEAGFNKFLKRPLTGDSSTGVSSGTFGGTTRREIPAMNIGGGMIGSGRTIYLGSNQLKIDSEREQIIVDDGSDRVIIIGKQDDGTYGINILSGTLTIGSGDSVFVVDADGNMWIGDATQGDAPFQVSNTGNVLITAADGDAFVKFDSANTRILMNDGSNNRVVIDTSGMKVSDAGYNVLTTTLNHLIMDSGYNMFKIVASGTKNVFYAFTATSSDRTETDSGTVTHNLGYIPTVMLFIAESNYYYNIPFGTMGAAIPGSWIDHRGIWYNTTTTTLTINITQKFYRTAGTSVASSDTLTFKYYLMRETQT